jgi:hypothetical protein
MDDGRVQDYGSEDDEEEEEDFVQPSGKKSKKVKKSVFADYEEFAHLLEDGLYDDDKEKKYMPKLAGEKRTF